MNESKPLVRRATGTGQHKAQNIVNKGMNKRLMENKHPGFCRNWRINESVGYFQLDTETVFIDETLLGDGQDAWFFLVFKNVD